MVHLIGFYYKNYHKAVQPVLTKVPVSLTRQFLFTVLPKTPQLYDMYRVLQLSASERTERAQMKQL